MDYSNIFQEDIRKKLWNKYIFGKTTRTEFTFTGLHIFQDEEMNIHMDQKNFIQDIPMSDVPRKEKEDPWLRKMKNMVL